ncbi:hypothetical protein B0T25DRAFT_562823 [Lasiosphaeria hispida]|uniref:Uncharacterized protein n=1 Tax=Lasiosphaeria hispida TaxID=260671 RepID=A0AAJ0HW58_9PEZI|nr:hypothetical protein B0T25DRAFT_562823 [Lasiosphaeria hispida]
MKELLHDSKSATEFIPSNIQARRGSLPSTDQAFTSTTQDDEDSVISPTDKDLRAEHFKAQITHVLKDHLLGDLDLANDITKRLDTHAQMYTNGKGPPLDDGPNSPVKYHGVMTAIDFQDGYQKNPLPMFKVKRQLLMIAYQEQAKIPHLHCRNLSGNMEAIHLWATAVIQNYVRLLEERRNAIQDTQDMAEGLVAAQDEAKRLQDLVAHLRSDGGESINQITTLRSEVEILKQRDTVLKGLYAEAIEKVKTANSATSTTSTKPAPHRHREDTPAETVRSFLTNLAAGSTPSGVAADNLEPYWRPGHPDQIVTTEQLLTHLWDEYSDPSTEENAMEAYDKLVFQRGENYKTFRNDFIANPAGRLIRQPDVSFKTCTDLANNILASWDSANDKGKDKPAPSSSTSHTGSRSQPGGTRNGTPGTGTTSKSTGTPPQPSGADAVKRAKERARLSVESKYGHLKK